jgi:urease accessory protein
MNSSLNITVAEKNGRTYLKNSFCTHPFKIGNITEDKSKGLLKLMIMSSSPGVLDGDCYNINIYLEEEAQLQVTTQGYQRIFTMRGEAKQALKVHLDNGGSFHYLPHPTVPHKLSNFKSTNDIYLKTEHDLLWSEIITCGRKLCNEYFVFTAYQNRTDIYVNDKLALRENILLQPLLRPLTSIGQLEGYTHQSSLLVINDKADIHALIVECKEFTEKTFHARQLQLELNSNKASPGRTMKV